MIEINNKKSVDRLAVQHEQSDRLNYMNCPGRSVWINEDTAATQ